MLMKSLSWTQESDRKISYWTISETGLGYGEDYLDLPNMASWGHLWPMTELYDRIIQNRAPAPLPPGIRDIGDLLQQFIDAQEREQLSTLQADIVMRIEQAIANRKQKNGE